MATAAAPAVSMGAVDAVLREAVRRVAATDPDPADPFRGLYISDEAALQLAAAIDGTRVEDRLAALAVSLGLDPLDTTLLAACAAPELDPRYGRLVAYLHDDVTRRRASPRLLARLLSAPDLPEPVILARLGAAAPLRASGAVVLLADEALPVAERPLKPDSTVVGALLGVDLEGAPPVEGVRVVRRAEPPPGRKDVVGAIARAIDAPGRTPLLCAGPDAEQVLAHAAAAPLVVVAAARAHEREVVAHARVRARLSGARVAVDGLERVEAPDRERLAGALAAWPERPLLLARRVTAARSLAGVAHRLVEVPELTSAERRALWARAAPAAAADEVDAVGARFELSAAQVADAARLAAEHGLGLPAAARAVSRRGLDELATLLTGTMTWDDLVLPADDVAVLRAISARLRHRDRVLGEWGFAAAAPAGGGLKALFAGESGTGKTFAAQVVANDLGLDAYRVDLAGVVSKYIGETEKNLDRVFDAAEGSNAVLLFDEADALFGKRSAVGDAHDRYANLEVAYLLQRIETYRGAVLLTTNLRQNLDRAFLRRLDFAVDFPMPERDDRLRLWRRHLPAAAPIADDLDLERLAAHVLSGGSIRNCAVAAAFAAADDGAAIGMRHAELAVRLEHRKLGRLAVAPPSQA